MSNRDGKNTENKQGSSVSESDNDSGLDLGLGLFLNPPKESTTEKGSEPAIVASNLEPKPPESSKQSLAELNEFERLAQGNEWSTLLGASESILENQQVRSESSEKWVEAQAWWILAQLELKSLPAGVLSAPLESMLDHLVGAGSAASKISEPDKEVEIKAEKNLTLVKRAAAQLVERYFSQGEMLSGMQLASRSRVLGGDLNALTTVIKQYSTQLDALSGSDQRLYSILCKELSIDSARKHFEKMDFAGGQSSSNLYVKDSTAADKYKELTTQSKKTNSFFFSTIIIFLLLLSIAAILFWLWNTPSTSMPFPPQANKLDMPNPSLEAPKPEPVTKVSELDAVLYGMGNKENNAVQQATNPAQIAVQPTTIPAVTAKPKIALDTKGPIESPGLRDLRGQRDRPKTDSDQRRDIVVPGPAIAPRFENFSDPRVFRIVRATNLMLKPSLNSDPVAGLNRGDRVKVIGVAGYWLKVMSRQGRVAYVLAEDTEPTGSAN